MYNTGIVFLAIWCVFFATHCNTREADCYDAFLSKHHLFSSGIYFYLDFHISHWNVRARLLDCYFMDYASVITLPLNWTKFLVCVITVSFFRLFWLIFFVFNLVRTAAIWYTHTLKKLQRSVRARLVSILFTWCLFHFQYVKIAYWNEMSITNGWRRQYIYLHSLYFFHAICWLYRTNFFSLISSFCLFYCCYCYVFLKKRIALMENTSKRSP